MAKVSKEIAEKELSKNMSNLKSNKNSSKARTITLKMPSSLEVKNDSNSKRTIKNIKPKTINETKENIEVTKKVELQEDTNTEIKQVNSSKSKRKRTLHLNLNDVKKEDSIDTIDLQEKEVIEITPSISHVVDTSVNQNSPFFSEPSVFEKLNIDIINISDEETQEPSDNDINNEIENSENDKTKSDIENNNISDTDFLELDDLFEKDEEKNEEKLQEEFISVSQNIDNTSSNTVENFFDSSIPNITSIKDDSHVSKIKKTIFAGISPIFKKFTFEEANLINNNNENSYQEITSNVTNISNKIHSTADSPISVDVLNKDLEISAKNTTNIPNVDVEQNIINSSTDNLDFDVNYEQIITPETNISDNFSVDDELIDELINNSDFLDEEFDDTQDLENKNLDSVVTDTIETSENTNNTNYNDDTFSIEEYFGLDNLTDEDLKNDIDNILENNLIDTEQEINLDNENISETENETAKKDFLPQDFAKRFFEENNVFEEINENNNSETTSSDEIINENDNSVATSSDDVTNKNNNLENSELINFSKLIENFNQTISTLSERIANLEAENSKLIEEQEKQRLENTTNEDSISNNNSFENLIKEDIEIEDLDINIDDLEAYTDSIISTDNEPNTTFDTIINDEIITTKDSDTTQDITDAIIDSENTTDSININCDDSTEVDEIINLQENLDVEDLLSDDFLLDNLNINDDVFSDSSIEKNIENEYNEPSTITSNQDNEILNDILDNDLEENLLEDMLLENIYQEDLQKINSNTETTTISEIIDSQDKPESDFLTIIDSLSKTISDLENSPDIKNSVSENVTVTNDKSINILIDKDDIFSISILNETYEIVADFDGISVLSENIHISTPKNNFFVEVGNKYIEIHKHKDFFIVNTNFEDVEFANAINNVTFAKKNNKIELNIKEAFKLLSGTNKLELSMLNTSIADISNSTNSGSIDENSICDNRTLLISEETQKVYLPYTIEEIMRKLNNSDEYQTAKEVIENEYTLPLSTFKMPIIARFKEAYRFMRIKEKSSIYAAIDLGLELMFNSELNPAIIRACKDLKELNIYLDCLYENEVDKFDCFKIVYKVLPKIQ